MISLIIYMSFKRNLRLIKQMLQKIIRLFDNKQRFNKNLALVYYSLTQIRYCLYKVIERIKINRTNATFNKQTYKKHEINHFSCKCNAQMKIN